MWLRDTARIEGLLTCHFIAMLISSLIERTIRHAMARADIDELSLYPEDRGCAAPTTTRILEIFTCVARHELTAPDGSVLRTFHPELQRQVLDLLAIPTSVYSPVTQIPLKGGLQLTTAGERQTHRTRRPAQVGERFPTACSLEPP